MGHTQKSANKEIHNNPTLPQKSRKFSNKQSNVTLKGTRKRKTNKARNEFKGKNNQDQSGNT